MTTVKNGHRHYLWSAHPRRLPQTMFHELLAREPVMPEFASSEQRTISVVYATDRDEVVLKVVIGMIFRFDGNGEIRFNPPIDVFDIFTVGIAKFDDAFPTMEESKVSELDFINSRPIIYKALERVQKPAASRRSLMDQEWHDHMAQYFWHPDREQQKAVLADLIGFRKIPLFKSAAETITYSS